MQVLCNDIRAVGLGKGKQYLGQGRSLWPGGGAEPDTVGVQVFCREDPEGERKLVLVSHWC